MILTRHPQPRIRSLLFVPGNKPDWMRKATTYRPDALIFDLEDSVPPEQKGASRRIVREMIQELAPLGKPRLLVRINAFSTGLAESDLEAVVTPGLFGVQVPKTEGPDALRQLDATISKFEQRTSQPPGKIFLIPIIETAEGVRQAYKIAVAVPRVGYMVAGAGGDMGDMAMSVGYRESGGLETAYIFGKLILDARAAGTQPQCGLVADRISDLAAVKARAERLRNFGYTGANLIHPSHIQIANEVFGPSKAEINYWRGLIEAVEAGQRQHTAAVVYEGKMVDIAHLNHARDMLKQAAEFVDSGAN